MKFRIRLKGTDVSSLEERLTDVLKGVFGVLRTEFRKKGNENSGVSFGFSEIIERVMELCLFQEKAGASLVDCP